MQPEHIVNNQLRLLSSIDLDEVQEIVSEIFLESFQARGLAILMWDRDLEISQDNVCFGPAKREIAKVANKLSEWLEDEKEVVEEIEPGSLGCDLPSNLEPIYLVRVRRTQDMCLCAGVLLFGAEVEDIKELEELVGTYPFAQALYNSWEHRELEKENQRLRSQYEEIEDKTSMLEEQTMKLIHDVTARDSIRTKQLERERLVYWISNAVRSSLQIQQVLDMTAEKIGDTFGVSRCLFIRPLSESSEELDFHEYTRESTSSVREVFFTDAGKQFTKKALNTTTPTNLEHPDVDTQATFDKEFLKQLDYCSGLIVPLLMRDRVLGVIFLQDCLMARDWSIDDISLLGSLADHLSVAIENAELHLERERQAVTDGLTGVANRRCFSESFTREFERARRYEQPLSLVVIDLDFLKKINDTWGHQVGDEAIKGIGRVLKQSIRAIDLAARYGGEEFCLLLPNTELNMAEQFAERIRRLINDVEVEGHGKISASLGVATYPAHADDPDTLFLHADEALYLAKQSGRNQVKTWSQQAAGNRGTTPVSDAAKEIVR